MCFKIWISDSLKKKKKIIKDKIVIEKYPTKKKYPT